MIRLDGTNAEEGRRILATPASRRTAVTKPTMLDAAEAVVDLPLPRPTPEELVVAIFVDQDTKVIFQGLTGGQGRFTGCATETTARTWWRA